MMKRRHFSMTLAGAALAAASPLLRAQAWPSGPVTWVLSQPPGSGPDNVARILGERLGKAWGQPVVIQNKPGGQNTIGAQAAARAPADGHNFYFATTAALVTNPLLFKKLPYDPQKDFTPIAHVWSAPNVMVVSPALGVSDVKGFIALAKAKPGQLNFASSGIGTIPHLSAELFKLLAGVDLVHVPYKGTGLSIPDIATGQVAVLFDSIVTAQQHARTGKVKMLAVSTAQRSPLLPELPTMQEAGVPEYESNTWFGLFAAAGTPREIAAKVNADANALAQAGDVRERFAAAGAELAGGSPEAFAQLVRAEFDKWSRVIRAANVKVQ